MKSKSNTHKRTEGVFPHAWVKSRMYHREISQATVCTFTDARKQLVSLWLTDEDGARQTPDIKYLPGLCRVLECNVGWLTGMEAPRSVKYDEAKAS